jgi:hypothetical protein
MQQQRTSLCGRPLFRCAYRVKKIEELINPRDFQGITNAIADPGQRQPTRRVLPSDVRAHQGADTRRIGVRNVGKINHQSLRLVRPNHGLKFEHRGENQRAIKNQNPLPRLASRLIRNLKCLFRHAENINLHVTINC